jgi:bifunctional non-homologous end joining protein LigD
LLGCSFTSSYAGDRTARTAKVEGPDHERWLTMGRRSEPLAEYRKKRAFDRTPEPSGEPGERRDRNRREQTARFVVQEHHARRLHWDLRLERDGVLASWALPRGFPDTPDQNRLAVHTEDHPLDYLTFHGDIPAGEYGGGAMTVWDSGTYEAEKFTDDKVVFRLYGERVRGRYALFRTHDKNWMIHRMDPPDPGRDPMPESTAPMRAALSRLPADEADWGFELAWHGVRALAYGEPGRVRLVGRNLHDITKQYPEVGPLVEQLGARHVVLDGVLVAFDQNGIPSFRRLQRRLHATAETEIRRRRREVPVAYVAFDLLYLDGRSLLDRGYEERRNALEALQLDGPNWQTPKYHRGDGAALFAASREHGLEGVVAKRLDSTYHPGRSSRDWLKIENSPRQDVVIGGWVAGENGSNADIDALLVGYYEPDGEQPQFHYAGKVDTGFDATDVRFLMKRLKELRIDSSPFHGRQPQRDANFVRPALVCEVRFSEWTTAGTMRRPSYDGLRDDKPPTEVVKELPVDPPNAAEPPDPRDPEDNTTRSSMSRSRKTKPRNR